MRTSALGMALAGACLAGAAGADGLADGFADADALRTLSGTYASAAPEPWYGGYGTREFTFGGGRWELVFTHALDPGMERKTFQFITEGPYAVGDPVAAVPGAFEGDFTEEVKKVRLLMEDPETIAAFGMAGCGLIAGEVVDISETGCANWKPVAECGVDHDLLAMDGAGIYFGVRPADNDMCTPDRRPTKLLMPVVRQ